VEAGKYFNLRELCDSDTAARHGLPNNPTPEAVGNLRALCEHVLDPLRESLKRPIVITSGYRSPQVNKLVGGSRTSQHLTGEAVDFKVPGLTPTQVFDFIRASNLDVDQCIWEFGQWCHVSYSQKRRRNQFLIARRVGAGTQYTIVERKPEKVMAQGGQAVTERASVQAGPLPKPAPPIHTPDIPARSLTESNAGVPLLSTAKAVPVRFLAKLLALPTVAQVLTGLSNWFTQYKWHLLVAAAVIIGFWAGYLVRSPFERKSL